MAVKILGTNEASPPSKIDKKKPEIYLKVDQFEVFGRMRLNYRQIGEYYGITRGQVDHAFTKPEIREAYDRGRAETVIAIRQKQLQVGLAGDVRMLMHIGYQFGELDKTPAELEDVDMAPSRFSWDAEMKRQVNEVRAKLLAPPEE